MVHSWLGLRRRPAIALGTRGRQLVNRGTLDNHGIFDVAEKPSIVVKRHARKEMVDRVIVLVSPKYCNNLTYRAIGHKGGGVHIAPDRRVRRMHNIGEQEH